MKIAISGSSGFIGSHLLLWCAKQSFQVMRLIRQKNISDYRFPICYWNADRKEIDLKSLENCDVIIHLAGENIAAGKWTPERKERIRSSRISGTRFLAQSLTKLAHPPKLFISASAIGYYGHRPDERLTEESPAGEGFLASVVKEWEESTLFAHEAEIRTVQMRIGMVLSPQGGALKRMLPVFKFGLGGKVGKGSQMMSWIDIDEIPKIIYHLITHPEISGPVNVTSPTPVTNEEFSKLLGQVLRRPTWFPLPTFLARLILGEMADALLLNSSSILPRKLQVSGYHFTYPDLLSSFRHLFSQPY